MNGHLSSYAGAAPVLLCRGPATPCPSSHARLNNQRLPMENRRALQRGHERAKRPQPPAHISRMLAICHNGPAPVAWRWAVIVAVFVPVLAVAEHNGHPPAWWQWGNAPYPLQVPENLAELASPIWHAGSLSGSGGNSAPPSSHTPTAQQASQFAFARVLSPPISLCAVSTAVAFVTAQQSPLCQPDARLDGNDYGSCIPHGGSSQAKLLAAYKLWVNGNVVGIGPGRRVNQTQGVDAIDLRGALVDGANAFGLEGFHRSIFTGDAPRMLMLVRITYVNGSVTDVPTDAQWRTYAHADAAFGPDSSTGAWAGGACSGPVCGRMPQENLDRRVYPAGWATSAFQEAHGEWSPAAIAPPFVLPLTNKPGRPVAVFSRTARSVTKWEPSLAAKEAGAPSCVGCYVIDYGLELQGGVNLTFSVGGGSVVNTTETVAAPPRVVILLSEELAVDGTPLVPMHTGNNFTSMWTLNDTPQGAAANSAIMQHEYAEFRYAMVMGAPSPLTTGSANAWVIRYPLGDTGSSDYYGDTPTLATSLLRRPAALASFTSSSAQLNSVWGLVRHTLVACGGLDVNVDSNTRQRDFCATDAFITGLGQLAISSDYGMPAMTAINGFQLDSNIWQGMTDFRAALISLAYSHALYTGDLSLLRQRWADIKKHSFVYFFDEAIGAVNKPPAFMGSHDCQCPESWSPAGMPPGIYEALQCTCTDLNDWPRQCVSLEVLAGGRAPPYAKIMFPHASTNLLIPPSPFSPSNFSGKVQQPPQPNTIFVRMQGFNLTPEQHAGTSLATRSAMSPQLPMPTLPWPPTASRPWPPGLAKTATPCTTQTSQPPSSPRCATGSTIHPGHSMGPLLTAWWGPPPTACPRSTTAQCRRHCFP